MERKLGTNKKFKPCLGGNETPLSPGLVISPGLQGRKPVHIPGRQFFYVIAYGVTAYGLILIISVIAPSTFSRMI
jgi:hypothetical protein